VKVIQLFAFLTSAPDGGELSPRPLYPPPPGVRSPRRLGELQSRFGRGGEGKNTPAGN